MCVKCKLYSKTIVNYYFYFNNNDNKDNKNKILYY